jgi:hypothetical protein
MTIAFNKTTLAVMVALAFSAAASVSVAQTAATSTVASNNTSSAQGLCCDTVQGKCVVPMPNRPSPSRVSEPGRYGDLQKRLDKLDTGNCANAYTLNKAQAWLNMSRDVMHEGDGASVINAAYDESEKLIKALEEGKTASLQTELVAGADKVRPDLWDIAAARKATPALLSSAAREVAYCEVYLVRAGHAQAKLGGKARTEPLMGMAQDICQAAKDKPACPVVAAPVVAPAPALVPAPISVPVPVPQLAAPVATPPVVTAAPVVAPKRAVKQDRN